MLNIIKAAVPYSPDQCGYRAERLEKLDAHYSKLIEAGKVQGVFYAMARDGKLFANRAMGRASFRPEDERLCQPDSIRRIASITKIFTASAILKLAEDGAITATDPVSQYIVEFKNPMHEGITIFNLLTHTSGLAPDGGAIAYPFPINPWDIWDNKEHFKRNWIESYLSMPMRDKPGKEWGYSSLGFSVLAEIVQRVSGMTIAEFVKKNFFEPLEMADTYYEVPKEKQDRVVVSSEYELPSDDKDRNEIKLPPGGGGIKSTAPDLLKFGQMFLDDGVYNGKHILSRKTVEKLHTDLLPPEALSYCWGDTGKHGKYGLGFNILTGDGFLMTPGVYGHEGYGRCELLIDPVERFVWVQFAVLEGWVTEALVHSKNIVWSGLL